MDLKKLLIIIGSLILVLFLIFFVFNTSEKEDVEETPEPPIEEAPDTGDPTRDDPVVDQKEPDLVNGGDVDEEGKDAFLNCIPSTKRIESTGVFPIDPIYFVDIIKNYTIKGYDGNNNCEIYLSYEKIEFRKSNFTRNDFVNYFMETYNLNESSVDQDYMDYLVESLNNMSNINILRFNNQYYDFMMDFERTCLYNSENIGYLVSDISYLDESKYNSFSLFNDNQTERIYTNCNK